MSELELYHHGILGQKWGIRRYQNKDGSLTKAGKARADKLASEYEKTTGKKISDHGSSSSSSKPKTINEMSVEELKARKERLNAEKELLDAQKNHLQARQQLAALTPQQVSKGRAFAEGIAKDVLIPAAKDVGRKFLTEKLSDLAGLNVKSETDKLKEEYTKWDYRAKIKEAKDKVSGNKSNEDESKKLQKEASDYENRQKIDRGQKYFKEGKYKEESSEASESSKESKSSNKSPKISGATFHRPDKTSNKTSEVKVNDWSTADHTNKKNANNGEWHYNQKKVDKYFDNLSKNEEEYLKRFMKKK